MSVFKKQNLLRIELQTYDEDLASASVKRILYKKPDGTKGYWEASIDGTKLYYDLTINYEVDQIDTWEFQAYVVKGGLEGYGNIATQIFEKHIK